jgi:hypothetical protein
MKTWNFTTPKGGYRSLFDFLTSCGFHVIACELADEKWKVRSVPKKEFFALSSEEQRAVIFGRVP